MSALAIRSRIKELSNEQARVRKRIKILQEGTPGGSKKGIIEAKDLIKKATKDINRLKKIIDKPKKGRSKADKALLLDVGIDANLNKADIKSPINNQIGEIRKFINQNREFKEKEEKRISEAQKEISDAGQEIREQREKLKELNIDIEEEPSDISGIVRETVDPLKERKREETEREKELREAERLGRILNNISVPVGPRDLLDTDISILDTQIKDEKLDLQQRKEIERLDRLNKNLKRQQEEARKKTDSFFKIPLI